VKRFSLDKSGPDLRIVGLGADDHEVGSVSLSNGEFTDDDGQRVQGRILGVQVDRASMMHQSEGQQRMDLPIPSGHPEMEAFLLDSRLASLLDEMQIGFHRRAVEQKRSSEVPFDDCSYTWPVPVYECAQGPGANPDESYELACGFVGDQSAGPHTTSYSRSCGPASPSECGNNGKYNCSGCWTPPATQVGWVCHVTYPTLYFCVADGFALTSPFSCCTSAPDCNGVCGGPAVADCAGVCGGSAVRNACGVCNGPTGGCDDCGHTWTDCNGTPCGSVTWTDCAGTVCGGQNNCCAPDCTSSCVNACNSPGCENPGCCGATPAQCSCWCGCGC
jgi:hypothetical protein